MINLILTWSVSPDRSVADCSSGEREYPNTRSVLEEGHSRGSGSRYIIYYYYGFRRSKLRIRVRSLIRVSVV